MAADVQGRQKISVKKKEFDDKLNQDRALGNARQNFVIWGGRSIDRKRGADRKRGEKAPCGRGVKKRTQGMGAKAAWPRPRRVSSYWGAPK